jgi:hypothetical protein
MNKSLSDLWEKKYPTSVVVPTRGVISVSFNYWQGFGGRMVAGDVTLTISGSEKPEFSSVAEWPHENLEGFVCDGVIDAMHQYSGALHGLAISLVSVGWHDVSSCGSGFYFAGREAMHSALRILAGKDPR